ncbi:MAG: hypothetical protein V3S01_01405, partial [Dehalococcoidia bacterium]
MQALQQATQQSGGADPFATSQLLQQLMTELSQPLNIAPVGPAATVAAINPEEVDPNAVNRSGEQRAFRIARERERARQQNAAAERLGASGLSGSGATDAEVNLIGESAGQDVASNAGEIAARLRATLLGEETARFNSETSNANRDFSADQAR